MSTYNGEKYLREQIDSILNQDYPEISLLIRDDGSTDGTVDILKEYAQKYRDIDYYVGENLGVQNSFFDLMKRADKRAYDYAFADQDDVWLPGKIKRAIELLEREDEKKDKRKPLLYGGRVTYASENLEYTKEMIFHNRKDPGLGNALVENIFIGCTEVFNKELLQLVILHIPKCEILHDWWLYLSASCFGSVIYDQNSYLFYRQHLNNQVGIQNSWIKHWIVRKKRFGKRKNTLSDQAWEFIRVYGTQYEKYKIVAMVAEYKKDIKSRCYISRSGQIYRQQRIDDIIYRILFLLGVL